MSKPAKKKYILGTRGSLLATTQATQVAIEIQQKAGCEIELKIIKTQGDQIVDKPLWQLDGKDFFTKELDHALLAGDVDFVVHSLKDLGSERPTGLHLAAVTKRLFPNDILLISRQKKKLLVTKKWPSKQLVVGTSSPRRIANIGSGLKEFLPFGEEIELEISCQVLRGNVNSRVEKLLAGNYDAIVLATTGLERLARFPESLEKMKPHFQQLDFMYLPQQVFPTAAGQGALGIECRQDDLNMQRILASVHHTQTHSEVMQERKRFKSYGGGCHLAVGIFSQEIDGKLYTREKGIHQESVVDVETYDHKDVQVSQPVKNIFVGLPTNKLKKIGSITPVGDDFFLKKGVPFNLPETGHLLVASGYGTDELAKKLTNQEKDFGIWAAGLRSMRRLAAQGIWCHGSLEGLGESKLKELLEEGHFLQAVHPSRSCTILSHSESQGLFPVVACYERVETPVSEARQKELKTTSIFYWTSYDQFLFYKNIIPANALHCCGAGKTFERFKQAGQSPLLFPTMTNFYNWIKSHSSN